jgi:hypothetical protein
LLKHHLIAEQRRQLSLIGEIDDFEVRNVERDPPRIVVRNADGVEADEVDVAQIRIAVGSAGRRKGQRIDVSSGFPIDAADAPKHFVLIGAVAAGEFDLSRHAAQDKNIARRLFRYIGIENEV